MRIFCQSITAGDDFDGTSPSTTPVLNTKDIEKNWPADDHGGLFNFNLRGPARLDQLELTLGGQSAWDVIKVDCDGDEYTLFSGTNQTEYITHEADRIILLEDETIKISTTGATAALKARIIVTELP